MKKELWINAGLAAVAAIAGAVAATAAEEILPASWLAFPIVGILYGGFRVGAGIIAVKLNKTIPVDE